MTIFGALVLVLRYPFGVLADEPTRLNGGNLSTVGVLAWNVFMMPRWTHESPGNAERARAIGAELLNSDYDILVLEKVFDADARRILDEILAPKYPYRYGPVNSSGCSLKLNGGVYVLSRLQLSEYREIQFQDSADVEVFSRKGAMLLTGSVSGHGFQLVATHLQGDDAGPSSKFRRIRTYQMDQIAELISVYGRPDIPLFIAGDFVTPRWPDHDVEAETRAYRVMLEMFGAENGPEQRVTLDDNREHNELAGDNSKREAELDYVLVRKNGRSVRGTWERKIFRHPWGVGGSHRDLSYRYAVGARFVWQ